ncbi:YlcI/YnfO family protein [Escherichia coli]|uniref:YlcI/YnfO family protein n=1 Tax=Escherichia coli TaxID=562 RepID=UPI00158EA13C|nr:YlcI/YnfO family protein [Escherichia coli]
MATGNINSRSQMKNIRFPHDVIEEMENSKTEGETIASFVITAVRGEIARRQAEGSGENPLVSSLDALEQMEKIGVELAENIEQLVSVAREELQRRKAKGQKQPPAL